MKNTSPAQLELATQLLAYASRSAPDPAAAAAQLYERIFSHLAPIISEMGVHALFARSIVLCSTRYPWLEGGAATGISPLEASSFPASPIARLGACLKQSQSPPVALEAAEAVFGSFFTLLATFIGERLTAQVLKRAWPEISDLGSVERKS